MHDVAECCLFCGASDVRRSHTGLFHPLKHDHGPFEFHECRDCGSGMTLPPPSAESLRALYASFDSGLPQEMRRYLADDPQTAWYQQCLDRAMTRAHKRSADVFRWIDVGAGGGELARLAAQQYPNAAGTAVDLHARPALLDGCDNVDWITCDINRQRFAASLDTQADVVISIAVWEHVRRPDWFMSDLASLVKKNGTLYVACPDYGSPASRVLGRWWPYFTPGEHLCMPSVEGANRAISRVVRDETLALADAQVFVHRVSLPYTLRYVLRFFRLGWIGSMLPKRWRVALPAGALEAGFTCVACDR